MNFTSVGLLLNSALYLVGCFVAGVGTANPFAWKMALTSAGLCYVTYFVQQVEDHAGMVPGSVILGSLAASIVAGFLAGVSLLF